ncbi:MAG: Rrf2 family transcriptional regulator [Candidatus Sumerlaeia bacterium]|nr:Rrf2 family transcriptional regulator [Candidatus Sumerlaeia bacterium]
MQLSKKTDYALRALMCLIEADGRELLSIRELSERNDIPKPFLEHILLDLKKNGWIESFPGKNGGYKLRKSAEEISIGEVVRHFDGMLAPINCVSKSNYEPCSQEAKCRFRRVMLQVRNQTAYLMDKLSLATVFQSTPVMEHEFQREDLFFGGEGI